MFQVHHQMGRHAENAGNLRYLHFPAFQHLRFFHVPAEHVGLGPFFQKEPLAAVDCPCVILVEVFLEPGEGFVAHGSRVFNKTARAGAVDAGGRILSQAVGQSQHLRRDCQRLQSRLPVVQQKSRCIQKIALIERFIELVIADHNVSFAGHIVDVRSCHIGRRYIPQFPDKAVPIAADHRESAPAQKQIGHVHLLKLIRRSLRVWQDIHQRIYRVIFRPFPAAFAHPFHQVDGQCAHGFCDDVHTAEYRRHL